MEEIDFLETGRFQLRAVPLHLDDPRPPPKNYLYKVGVVLKISSKFHQKLFNFFLEDRHTCRQTDRQTISHPYTESEILCPFSYLSVHSVSFAQYVNEG
jgi:hypothetical protein